jgi:phosphoglycerate dehydrogenase-like enzyme
MKVVATQAVDEAALRAAVPGVDIVLAGGEDLPEAAMDADALIGWLNRSSLLALLESSKTLKWIHLSSAGVDGVLCPELIRSDVMLTCAKGDPVGPLLAEHAFALALSLSRGIHFYAREKGWTRGGEAGRKLHELGGKTMGIVGYGGVGKALVPRARGFGMEVIAVRRNPDLEPSGDVDVWGTDRFHEMLSLSDVVVVTVPGTPETDGMFDREAFRRMRSNSTLVTVGRGKTVDTDALVWALEEEEISGAGLDVVDPEPLPDDHPLWTMPNVIITPHVAGDAPEREPRNRDLVAENLRRLDSGEPLVSMVDKEAGY